MANENLTYMLVETAMGHGALVASSRGLRSALLPGLAKEDLVAEVERRHPGAVESDRGLRGAARAFENYFLTGKVTGRAPKLDLDGVSPFRLTVYEALLDLAPGQVVTYAELARRVGRPGAHRSVGTALSRNPIPVFIPCHRVVRTDGGLGGFTAEGGIELKEAMLALEGAR
jgi:methylated-DNA-[protein]-cysteine S-methyltransferase